MKNCEVFNNLHFFVRISAFDHIETVALII